MSDSFALPDIVDFSEDRHDRRGATAADIQRMVDQNQGICNTIQALVSTQNNHETRITVLEVKANISNKEAEEIKTNGEKTLAVLAEHTRQEDKDRARLLIAVILTLVSVVGGIIMIVIPHFLEHIGK